MISIAALVAQKVGFPAAGGHHNVDIPVIIQIPKGGAPAGPSLRKDLSRTA